MKIIYEDRYLIIVNKPAGLSVLPDGWEKDSEYLVKMLEEQYGKVFIVHRLDKITSGVMVFAREAETQRALNIQFENREAQKTYHAIVEGNPKWDEKIAKHPLRAKVGHKHRTMVDDKNGKPSETRFKILKRYPESALIEARPMTGRTHQIRVHLAAIDLPVSGDPVYGVAGDLGLDRQFLHAARLAFEHPVTGERLELDSPLPEDLPAVGGGGGSAVIMFSKLDGVGGVPETQRLAYRVLGDGCIADFNGDTVVNTQDFAAYLNAWAQGDARADINGDTVVNTQDFALFLNLWAAGCP